MMPRPRCELQGGLILLDGAFIIPLPRAHIELVPRRNAISRSAGLDERPT